MVVSLIQFRRESKSRPERRTGMKGIDALEEAAALHEALPPRAQQRSQLALSMVPLGTSLPGTPAP